MPVFVLRLKAPGPRFAQTLTDAVREVMARHGPVADAGTVRPRA